MVDHTITMWVRTEANDAADWPFQATVSTLLSAGANAPSWVGFLMEMHAYRNGDNVQFYLASFGTSTAATKTSAGMYDGTWKFIVCTSEAAGSSKGVGLSINGSSFATNGRSMGVDRNPGPWDFSSRGFDAAVPQIKGYWNQIVFWNKLLDLDDVTSLYNGGAGRTLTQSEFVNDIQGAWADDVSPDPSQMRITQDGKYKPGLELKEWNFG
jgi:hypothetical protein